ncbi:hypothetical protein CYMTET_38487 [Cymbomonas tetramitiformis]|uniref:BTB domain-containing protein n=1 Tax=Cymbomonas tetramitiformis TaxID=36881 RepID=A0AAE0F575_9CHLO|nr:hypothetical protein CYMTET_38487 [Cymbomonas tetramitiformis]
MCREGGCASRAGVFTLKVPVRYETDALSDVRVRLVGKAGDAVVEFDCHRFVLAQGSTYLRDLFKLFPDERVLKLHEVKAKEFEALLGVLYGQESLVACADRVCMTTESFFAHVRMADYIGCEALTAALLCKVHVIIVREVTQFVESRDSYVEELYGLCRDHQVCLTDTAGLRPPQNALIYRMVDHVRESYSKMFDAVREEYGIYHYNNDAPKRVRISDTQAGIVNVNFRRVLSLHFVRFEDVVRDEDPPWIKNFAKLSWCDKKSKFKETERYISQFRLWDEEIDPSQKPRPVSLAPMIDISHICRQ